MVNENKLVGHSSDIRTLDERDLAAMRPQVAKPKRRTASRQNSSAIATVWRCPRCGERRDDPRDQIAHLAAELAGNIIRAEGVHYDADPMRPSFGRPLCAEFLPAKGRSCNAVVWHQADDGRCNKHSQTHVASLA